MIRGKRNDAYGRQTLRVDCCGWDSYREAVSYIMPISQSWGFGDMSDDSTTRNKTQTRQNRRVRQNIWFTGRGCCPAMVSILPSAPQDTASTVPLR